MMKFSSIELEISAFVNFAKYLVSEKSQKNILWNLLFY